MKTLAARLVTGRDSMGFARALISAALAAALTACGEPRGCAELVAATPGASHWMELEGRPLIPIGDSVTQGWMELGLDFDQEAYLDTLAEAGVNALLLWSYIAVVDQQADVRIGYDAPVLWPWPRQDGQFDLARFNELYFERLRALAVGAGQRGILVVLTVHDGWTKRRFDGHPFNVRNGGPLKLSSQYVELASPGRFLPNPPDPSSRRRERNQYLLERFCARLIAATGDLPNVVYEIFNEGEWYDHEDLHKFQRHFLAFFEARTQRPLMVNEDYVADPSFHEDPRVDLISLHKPNWNSSTSAQEAFEHYARHFVRSPSKPFFFSEPVPSFEGDAETLLPLMRLMWGTALAGAGFLVQNDTSFGFAPRSGMARHEESRTRMYALAGHAARFLNDEISFAEMVPDGKVSSTCVALARRRREYAIYVQGGEGLSVDLRDAPGEFVARLYDPWNGIFQAPFRVTGGEWVSVEVPGVGDWVLHLVAAGD